MLLLHVKQCQVGALTFSPGLWNSVVRKQHYYDFTTPVSSSQAQANLQKAEGTNGAVNTSRTKQWQTIMHVEDRRKHLATVERNKVTGGTKGENAIRTP